jgi:transposase
MKRGRPSKYKAEMRRLVVEYGEQGLTDCEIAVKLGITTQTLYDWAKTKNDFSYSLEMAHDACDAWFARALKDCVEVNEKKMNPVPLMFLAKTRRHWREKWDVDIRTDFNSEDIHKFDAIIMGQGQTDDIANDKTRDIESRD